MSLEMKIGREKGTGDGSEVDYAYDAVGRRISRTAQGTTIRFLYDGNNVVLDLISDGRTVNYLNGPGIDNKLRQFDSTNGALYSCRTALEAPSRSPVRRAA